MTTYIEVAELGPKWEALVESLAENGGEINLTRDGKAIAKLIRTGNASASRYENEGPLAGSIIYEGDIISPIDEEWEAAK
jgi:antitoxin (DNA-binding transcriptional repressor) of toxin-antitoxin stability system